MRQLIHNGNVASLDADMYVFSSNLTVKGRSHYARNGIRVYVRNMNVVSLLSVSSITTDAASVRTRASARTCTRV